MYGKVMVIERMKWKLNKTATTVGLAQNLRHFDVAGKIEGEVEDKLYKHVLKTSSVDVQHPCSELYPENTLTGMQRLLTAAGMRRWHCRR